MRNSIFSISLNKRKISLAYQQRRMQFAQKELLSSFAIACQNFATQHTSVASLKGHLSPEAISYLLVSTVYLERLCYRLSSVTNVSPHLDLVSEESGQPYKAGGVVPYCALPISNPLRAVYDSGAMHRALEAAIGVPVFSYDLPYGAVNAIFMRHGENQNWHFDFADFTFILFLRTVKIGGQFSYRAASNEEFCALPNSPRQKVSTFPKPSGECRKVFLF